MFIDPIVEEVRKVRGEHARRFDYDAHKILADFQKMQDASLRKMFTPPSKRTKSERQSSLR